MFFCAFSHQLKEPSSEGQEWTSLLGDLQLPSQGSTSSLQTSTLVNHTNFLNVVLQYIYQSLRSLNQS